MGKWNTVIKTKGENKEWRTRRASYTEWPLVHIIYNGTRGHFQLIIGAIMCTPNPNPNPNKNSRV